MLLLVLLITCCCLCSQLLVEQDSLAEEHVLACENDQVLVRDVLENPCENERDQLVHILFIAAATTCPLVLSLCLETCQKEAPLIELFLEGRNHWDGLMEDGKVDLLQVFHEHGYLKKDTLCTAEIKDVRVIKFLYANQFNEDLDSKVMAMFHTISVDDLCDLLDNGLDLFTMNLSMNMLELALKVDRLDLASLLFPLGLGLHWDNLDQYEHYPVRPGRLAMHLAGLEVAPKIQLLLVARHYHDVLPAEMLGGHIGFMMLRISFIEQFDSLFYE